MEGEDSPGLAVLLELNGEVFHMDSGYWIRIEARLLEDFWADVDRLLPRGK